MIHNIDIEYKIYRRLYNILSGMNRRCYNPKQNNYHRYGGRGIIICAQWILIANKEADPIIIEMNRQITLGFIEWALANGYESHLTIDRINNGGNYEPTNCRWILKRKQTFNKSKKENASSKYRGVYFDKKINVWTAYIKNNSQIKRLGGFKNELDAARAYNDYVIFHDLENKLNEFTEEELAIPQKSKNTLTKTSIYKGVSYGPNYIKKWIVAIRIKRIRYIVGRFDTEIQAAEAYNQYVVDNKLNKPLNNILQ